jgi:hypothetical protein
MGRSPALVCEPPCLEIEAHGAHSVDPPGPVAQRWHDHDGRLIATGGRSPSGWWMHWPGLATFLFDDDGPVRALPARAGLDETIRDSFIRGVTPVVLLARGYEGLHASATLHGRGLVALLGTSGTGKSTTAFALASLDAEHFSDDTIIYSTQGGSAVAWRLPFPVRVTAPAASFVQPPAASFVEPPARAAQAGPGTARIHRLYHLVRDPSVDPLAPAFEAVGTERRFELLLAHAHPFEMGGAERRRRFIESVMMLARDVDVWTCRFGPRLDALPAFAAALSDHVERV